MKKISKNEVLKEELRQLENEIKWHVKNGNYSEAQNLTFNELIKLKSKLK